MERRVLIVENENEFALSMASVLRSAGFQTATAENAADAQRELELRRPDLVVLRAELPDQSGFVLCGQIKKGRFGQNLPVLLLSSDVGQDGLAQHSQGPSAADGYLTIPFEMGELAEIDPRDPPSAGGGGRRHGPLAGGGAHRREPSHADAGDASGAAAATGAAARQPSPAAAARTAERLHRGGSLVPRPDLRLDRGPEGRAARRIAEAAAHAPAPRVDGNARRGRSRSSGTS